MERIEGFCTEDDWHRAYREINEFEQELYDWGAVVIKFWLHIDKDEQLARFNDRQNTPEKRWKITDEDWAQPGEVAAVRGSRQRYAAVHLHGFRAVAHHRVAG